jgi:hypothetical protein
MTVAALLSLGAASLSATLAVKLELTKLTEKSALIVIGKVDSKQAKWDAGKKGIWTHHSVTVSDTLKGKQQKTRDVVTRGGVVGTTGQNVSGSANLEVGAEYVFFLWKDTAGRYRLQGMVQGAFKLETREGVKYAKNSLSGLTIIAPTTLKPEKAAALEYKLTDLKKKVSDQQKNAKEDE